MNFDELNKIVAKEACVNICPICGTPYKSYHSRQRTCGTAECKRLWKNEYLKKRIERQREEDIVAHRKYRAEIQRRHRHKKRALKITEENLNKMQDYWGSQMEEQTTEDGIEYGARQTERTLAQVPKIDVEAFLKEINK